MLKLLRTIARMTTLPWRPNIHITRHAMYNRLRTDLEPAFPDPNCLAVLAVSGSEQMVQQLGLAGATVAIASYPEYDLLDLYQFPPDSFDVLVADQVLEHVEGHLQDAIAESFRVVRPGGFVIHTTCFLNPLHWGPKDLWRVSPDGLELLCRPYGDPISLGSWGNVLALILIRLGLRHLPTPPRWHPVGAIARWNDPRWPISTWIAVRKQPLSASVAQRGN